MYVCMYVCMCVFMYGGRIARHKINILLYRSPSSNCYLSGPYITAGTFSSAARRLLCAAGAALPCLACLPQELRAYRVDRV